MSRGHKKSKLESAQIKAWKFYQAWRKMGWAFTAHMDGRKIKVILSSKNKKKYFLSVIVLS